MTTIDSEIKDDSIGSVDHEDKRLEFIDQKIS